MADLETAEKPVWPEVAWRILVQDASFSDGVRVVEMSCCGFRFDADYTDGDNNECYTCPLCEPPEAP